MLNIIKSKRKVSLIFLTAIIACLIHFSPRDKRPGKILLIGLDGAGWNVMTPFIEEGKLPNIKRLIDNGSWGRLETLVPTTSEIVWTTIATGRSADAHGITSNLMPDSDTNEMVPPTSNLRRIKAIWNILSDHKKKVGIIGYRVSWPAEKVNGIVISERASDTKYRSELGYSEPPFAEFCSEEVFNSFTKGRNIPPQTTERRFVFDRDIFMSNAAKFLLRESEFDFFCLYLRGIDESSHFYLRYMFPEGEIISADDELKYKNIIRDYYIWCDSVIGDLLKIIDKNTSVIVVSDHGFKKGINRDYVFSGVDRLLEACGLKEFSYNSKKVELINFPSDIWKYNKNIRIAGELTREEFNEVRENAKNILNNIKDIDTGQQVFKVSKNTDEGFVMESDKKYISKKLGRYLLINGREYKISEFLTVDPISGEHDATDAVLIISGKNIRHHHLENASVYDIAPTVLYLLDSPVAADMPGKALTSAIDLRFLKRKPIRYTDTYEKTKQTGVLKPVRSPEDEEIIKERMRSLGYIN